MEHEQQTKFEQELIKQLKGIRRELEKIGKSLSKERKNEKHINSLPDSRYDGNRTSERARDYDM